MFEATARLKIREGELDGFKRQVTEIVRLTRDAERKPLRYDWFISEDGTECEVREAYANADALLAHQHRIAEAKMKLLHDFAGEHTMRFYGEPSPGLAAAMEAMGVTHTQFSLFQGLDAAAIELLDEVPA
jgi:quinol monooxygenase YgiN